MRFYRLLQTLLALIFVTVSLNIVSPAAACCGTTPEWFLTAFVENPPLCTNRAGDGGSVTWDIDYHLFGAPNYLSIYVWGDGVVSAQTNRVLNEVPGSSSTSLQGTTSWKWQPVLPGSPTNAVREVRVQLEAITPNDFRDGAVIRIFCGSKGVQSWQVNNVEGFFTE